MIVRRRSELLVGWLVCAWSAKLGSAEEKKETEGYRDSPGPCNGIKFPVRRPGPVRSSDAWVSV